MASLYALLLQKITFKFYYLEFYICLAFSVIEANIQISRLAAIQKDHPIDLFIQINFWFKFAINNHYISKELWDPRSKIWIY